MKNLLTSLSALAMIATASQALSADLADIPEDATATIEPDSYTQGELHVGANATVHISGDTDIFVDQLTIEDGARFIVASNGTNPHFFTLRTLDAQGVKNLWIEGNGSDGKSNAGIVAAAGANGKNARSRLGINAKKCSSGKDGAHGEDGAHGAEITVSMPNISPQTRINIVANGGDGGKGGKGSSIKSNCSGGRGGNAGNAGNAGDSGKVKFFIIPGEGESDELQFRRLEYVKGKILAVPGNAGAAGVHGSGGSSGQCGKGKPIPLGCGVHQIRDGAPGSQGKPGTPTPIEVAAMSLERFKRQMLMIGSE